jgi:hypothetical protein
MCWCFWMISMNYTHLILSMMYLSGMRPSWPLTLPRHQSLDTCENKTTLSPFLKLSSRSERAMKSNCAVASRHSDSATWELRSHYKYFVYYIISRLAKSKLQFQLKIGKNKLHQKYLISITFIFLKKQPHLYEDTQVYGRTIDIKWDSYLQGSFSQVWTM